MNKTRKLLNRIKLILVLFLGLGSILVYTPNIVKADGGTIIKDLELVDKQEVYYPGSIVHLKGNFHIPNDSETKVYKEGDTFEIYIPENMEVVRKNIPLGDKGQGVYDPVDHKMVFTFNENIEQLVNREGGFYLQLQVKDPNEEGEFDFPLEFTDENNKPILKETITYKNDLDETIGNSNENFTKSMATDRATNKPYWYIHINKSGNLNNQNITLRDNLGSYQKIDIDSFEISKYEINGRTSPESVEDYNLVVNADNTGFTLDVFIEEGYYYYIRYDVIYTGGTDNPDIYDDNKIKLKNNAALISENSGFVPMDSENENNTVEGVFSLDGWATGDNQYVDFELTKVDAITGDKLSNAVFTLRHKIYDSMTYSLRTNDQGIAVLDQKIITGLYILSEVEAPAGYKKMDDQEVLITFNQGKFEMTVENTPLPIEISGRKNWLDINGEETEAQETIIVLLKENGKLIRQSVIKKGDEPIFRFKNLPAKDSNGELIEYTVEEKPLEGFDSDITAISDKEFIITNKEAVKDTKTEIKGNKIWLDVDNEPVKPVKDITIKLYANDQYLKETTIKKDGPQEFVFENLDVYDSKNKEIKYTIKEEDIEGFTATYLIDKNTGAYEITNTVDTTSLKFEKQWFDKDGSYIDALEDIDVVLLADGVKYKDHTLSTDEKTYTFENLPVVNSDGEKIKYSVEEIDNGHYDPKIEYDESQDLWIIKNHPKPPVTVPGSIKTNIKGEKIWLDQNDNVIESQQDIVIELYADNIKIDEVTLEKGQTNFEFKDLDMYNTTTRDAIKYHVQEQEIDGFESDIKFENNNWIVTNKEVESVPKVNEFEIPFIKVWKDYDGNIIPAQKPITVNLYGNDDIVDTVTLTPEHKQEYNFVGLAELDENGNHIEYRVEEEIVEGFNSTVIQDQDTGQWIITNQSNEKPVTPPVNEEQEKPVTPTVVETTKEIEKPTFISPDTGISVSYLPYILIIVASTGFALIQLKKNKKLNKNEISQ